MGLEVGPELPRTPVGAMLIWLTDTAPNGWLLTYGQAISRLTYARLFALIGTTFGIGDGATTFNLPDLRGRLSLGQDDMGGVSANRVTNAQADSIGGSAGAENHTLIIAETPAHNHTIAHTHDVKHTHEILTSSNEGVFNEIHVATGPTKYQGVTEASSNPTSGASSNPNSGSIGGSGAHNNVQPYLTTNYIIKY